MALQAIHPLRLEEVLGLAPEDLDCDNMTLHIRRAVTHPNHNQPEVKDSKITSSHRTIGLSALALPYLQQMEAAGHTSAITLKYCVKGRETSSEAVAAVDRLYSA